MLLCGAALAQVPAPSGNLYGTALDEQGKSLPGVSVTLAGPGAAQAAVSDLHGAFHFLNLSPGTYSLELGRSGFAAARRELTIVIGKNEVMAITMTIAAEAEAVTVRGEAPTLDSRKTETGATFERKDLDAIPTTRDPWAILRQVPGVLVANMNVNGGDSGSQSIFVGKGSRADQNTYNLDGVGDHGSGRRHAGLLRLRLIRRHRSRDRRFGPVSRDTRRLLNLVTRRGTNQLRGSARAFYFFPSSVDSRDQSPSQGGWDYGLEAGGPLWKDHLWLWGAGARNQIPGQTFFLPDGEPVRRTSDIEYWNAKLDAQPVPANSLTLSYLYSNKVVDGRLAGFGYSQESTWDQTTPSSAYRASDSQVLSEKLFASIDFSYLDGIFTVTPEGGLDRQADLDADYVWHNSYAFFTGRAPQHQAGLTTSGFFDTGALRHELKFGFGYKHVRVSSQTVWPGDGMFGLEPLGLAAVTRSAYYTYEMNYYDTYVGDTIQAGNLTVNLGARFDYQQGKNLPSAVPASLALPGLLPAVQYAGDAGYPITWRLFQPRVGATYALGPDRKTLLRASYSRFVSQLGIEIYYANAFPGAAYLYYPWEDANGDHHVDSGELDLANLDSFRNVDPENPSSTTSVNQIASGLKAPTTDEFIVGVERQVFSDLSASIAYTHRSSWNQEFPPFPIGSQPLVGTTLEDYQHLGNAAGSVTDSNGFTLAFRRVVLRPDDRPATNGRRRRQPPGLSGDVRRLRAPDRQTSLARLDVAGRLRLQRLDPRPSAPGPSSTRTTSWEEATRTGPRASSPATVRLHLHQLEMAVQRQRLGRASPRHRRFRPTSSAARAFLSPTSSPCNTHDTAGSQTEHPDRPGQNLPAARRLSARPPRREALPDRVSRDDQPVARLLQRGRQPHRAQPGQPRRRLEPRRGGAVPPSDSFNAVAERLSDRTFRAGARISF